MHRFHSFPDVNSWCDLPPVHPSSFRGSLFGYLLDSDPIRKCQLARSSGNVEAGAQSPYAIPIRVAQLFERIVCLHILVIYHDPNINLI